MRPANTSSLAAASEPPGKDSAVSLNNGGKRKRGRPKNDQTAKRPSGFE